MTQLDKPGAEAAPWDPGRSIACAPASIIEIANVSLTYAGTDRRGVQALDRISASVRPNEFVSVIGPSGCGKSSLLRIIANLIEPSSGRVLISGRPASELRRHRQIGMMFQDSVLLPWKTVAQNIRLLCEVAGKSVALQTVLDLATMAGIGDVLDKHPYELSGGMRQRVALCRSLALDPILLLMDEPFGALDEVTREKMNLELLRIWQERRKTVVFVTHGITEAAFLSDRVLVMATHPGRIIADVPVNLPRPRSAEMRYSDELADYVRLLHQHMIAAEQSAQW